MADTAITVSVTEKFTRFNITSTPAYLTGSYVADDTDYHAFVFDARGKGRFSYCVDNASNKDVVVTLYGTHASDGEVGDTGTFAIDSSGITASAADKVYDTCADPFPYYIIRCKQAATPDSKTISIYVDLMAY